MGRKRGRTRQYFYISIACIIIISLAGCAMLREVKAKIGTRVDLITAKKLLDQGNFEGSLKENQKVLSLYSDIRPADEALFNIGVIYAHYGYPKRNYEKSLDHFKRLVKIFPHSPLAGQAKIWIGVLQEHERLNKTINKSKEIDIEIEEQKKELSK